MAAEPSTPAAPTLVPPSLAMDRAYAAIVQKLIDLALAGNTTAINMCLDWDVTGPMHLEQLDERWEDTLPPEALIET